MKKELFTELLESVREGSMILRGEQAPSRTFTIEVTGKHRAIQSETKIRHKPLSKKADCPSERIHERFL